MVNGHKPCIINLVNFICVGIHDPLTWQ